MTLNRILLALAVVSCPLASAQPAQSVAGTHTGCLLLKDGRYILQDDETQEIVELNGPDLDLNVGNHVRVLGRVSPAKAAIPVATKVIDVNSVSPRSWGGCLSVASSLGAQPNAPPRAVQEPPAASRSRGGKKNGP